ncbi:MAG: hypothetical protein JWL86_2804 [Rhizobium sp.]|nr:hypothetical protein [Rhizobium sp.]
MINGSNSSWTEARVKALVGLWLTEMTPEAIAVQMGGFDHTADGGRKAVIGKANRMGLQPKRVKAAQPTTEEVEALRIARRERQVEREKARSRTRIRSKSGALPRPKPEPKPAAAPFIGSLNIAFGDLRPRRFAQPNQCRFIEGDAPDYLACANETEPGKSYCGHHHAICYPASRNAPISDAERARRQVHGRALGLSTVRRFRVPVALFPVGVSPAVETSDATA